MRFSRVVDALDASGGKFVCVYIYVCVCLCMLCRRIFLHFLYALRVLCPFSCLHFLSSVVVEISSFSFFFFFCFLSHLILLSSISKFKQPMTYIWKGRRKEKRGELNIYFCWWILSLVAWVSPYFSFASSFRVD